MVPVGVVASCIVIVRNASPSLGGFRAMLGDSADPDITRCDPIDVAITEEDGGPFSLAKSHRRLGKSVQQHLKIKRRSADDLEHIGGGGLLLQ
jgi:hypothetical protein